MIKTQPRGAQLLKAAAFSSFALAALHFAVVFAGAPGYAYFGAPELGQQAARGSLVPALITLGLASIFALFGIYALSGAHRFRPLPFLSIVLVAIGVLFTLRGLILPFEVNVLLRGGAPFPPRYAFFSAVSLGVGLLYLAGTLRAWRDLRESRPA
jgi:hypothetical protein